MATPAAPTIDTGPIEKSIQGLGNIMAGTVKGIASSVGGIKSSIATIKDMPKAVSASVQSLKASYEKTSKAVGDSFNKGIKEQAKASLGGSKGIAEKIQTMRESLVASGVSQQEAQSQALNDVRAQIAEQANLMKSNPMAVAKAMGTVTMDGMKFLAGSIGGIFKSNASADKEKDNEDRRKDSRLYKIFNSMDKGLGAMGGKLSTLAKGAMGAAGKGAKGLMGMLKKGALFLLIPALIAFMNSPAFEELKTWIHGTLIPGIKKVVDIIMPIAKSVGAWVKDTALPIFMNMLIANFQALSQFFSDIFARFSGWSDMSLREKIGAVLGIFTSIGELVGKMVGNLIEAVLNLFGADGAALRTKYWDPIAQFFNDIVASIVLIFTDPIAGIKKLLGTIWNAASGVGKFLYDKLLAPFFTWIGEKLAFIPAGIAGMWTSVTDTVKEVWDSVVAWFEGLWTWASEGIAGTWTGLVGFIKEKFDGVITFLTDLFTWPKTPLGFVTKLIDIILIPYNLVINFLRDIFGWGTDEEGKTTPFSLGTFIVDAILAVVTWIKEKFLFAAATVVEGWTNLKTFISDAAIAIKDWFVEKFTFGKEAVIAGFTGLVTMVTDLGVKVWTWFKDLFSWGTQGTGADGEDTTLLGYITAIPGKIWSWIKGIFGFSSEDTGDVKVGETKGIFSKILSAILPAGLVDFITNPSGWLLNKLGITKDPDTGQIVDADGKPVVMGSSEGIFSKILKAFLPDGLVDFLMNPVGWVMDFLGLGGKKKEEKVELGVVSDPGETTDFKAEAAARRTENIQKISEWLPDIPFVNEFKLVNKMFDIFGLRRGGKISPGQFAMVGEEGPELIKFKQAGVVASNEQMHAGRDFAMNAMKLDAISQPDEAAGAGVGINAPVIINAPSQNSVANTKIDTPISTFDPFTQVARAY